MQKVAEVMTRGVRSMLPHDTVLHAAQAMEELNIGAIPVCEGGRVIGVVTDRDIVVRAVAQELPVGSTLLNEVMTNQVTCIFEDEDLNAVMAKMQHSQIRRLPVLDDKERLVGMLSLGDMASKAETGSAGDALADISEPAQPERGGMSSASGHAGGGAS
ncbi:MAG: CBS domain-containing protein [Comamonadaceae bacterium]|nr:CBS domain-containing protein [Comamonadaceae bacterium]